MSQLPHVHAHTPPSPSTPHPHILHTHLTSLHLRDTEGLRGYCSCCCWTSNLQLRPQAFMGETVFLVTHINNYCKRTESKLPVQNQLIDYWAELLSA